MCATILLALLGVWNAAGTTIPSQNVEEQNEFFEKYWGTEFEWRFDELPTEGTVPEYRVPYSGYIYPDRSGGTVAAMQQYDRAFYGGQFPATAWERWDNSAYNKPVTQRGGLFGLRQTTVMQTPHWHGHCNGWAAAAIRHAEPQNNVTRNGVVFTPADIKGLLAEIYIFNEILHLAGGGYRMNAGLFHAVITNWLGRGAHPVGMDADPGQERWNYPIYGYAISSARRSDREVEVKMNLVNARDTNREYQQGPRNHRTRYFHYVLNLDSEGRIIGGSFYRDSSRIALVWVPLRPKPGREPGNERGNPHLDIDKVLAIWRDSVSDEMREKWPVIDPPVEDRVLNQDLLTGLIPVQDPYGTAEPQQLANADELNELPPSNDPIESTENALSN
jgi:hypothetical protein